MIETVTYPCRIVSLTNVRTHWAVKAKRAKAERGQARLMARATFGKGLAPGETLHIRIVRIAPRALDCDNLRGACKSLRDGIADWAGVDDRDARIVWEYGQERGKPKAYAVRIEIVRIAAEVEASIAAALPDRVTLTIADCGDSGCCGRDLRRGSGMRTNGGCGCFGSKDGAGPSVERIKLRALAHGIQRLRKRNDEVTTCATK